MVPMPILNSLLAVYPLAHVAAGALGLVIYVAMAHFGRQRRHPSAAIAWVVAIVSFPFVALPLFLLIGSRKFVRPVGEPHFSGVASQEEIAPAWAARLSEGLLLPPARGHQRVELLDDGKEAFASLIRLIEQAQHRVDFCTFLFAGDEAGRAVADALAACAGRGCRVRVLLDAIGGGRAPRDIRQALAGAGVDVRRFTPLLPNFWRGRGNLRNHRKLAIADGARVWSGGRNIADEYFFDRPGRPAWKDLSFTVEGDLASDAVRLFERDWQLAGGAATWMPASSLGDTRRPGVAAQLIPSGPDQAADTLFEFLLNAIYQAQTRILAATPYFVPDDALLQALVIACRRGVHFQLVLPARSNHRLADWTRDRSLRELTSAGAEILLLPDMSHAKLVVVDEAVALCGSANLDGRSLFLNHEVSTAFYGRDEIGQLARWHLAQADMARGYVAIRPSLTRDVFEGLVRAVGFQL